MRPLYCHLSQIMFSHCVNLRCKHLNLAYSQKKYPLDTKFLVFWWFTHYCRKILSSRFTHLFRNFFENGKSRLRKLFCFLDVCGCSIYLLMWVFAPSLPIGSGAHSRPDIKWFHACCKWMYAIRSGRAYIHFNHYQNMPKFASMRWKSLKSYSCWQLLHLSLESRGICNPHNCHLMVSRWLLMSPIVSSHSTVCNAMSVWWCMH